MPRLRRAAWPRRALRGSAFSIEPSIDQIETGYYRIPAWNAVVRIYMTLRIVGAGGQVVDEIRLMDRKGFDAIAAPTANLRLTNVADALAAAVAEHIIERTNKSAASSGPGY